MQEWSVDTVCPQSSLRPRQFEYHPTLPNLLLFGTVTGEVVVCNYKENKVLHHFSTGLSEEENDSILGLCWLRNSPHRFVAGSSHGVLSSCDLSRCEVISDEERGSASATVDCPSPGTSPGSGSAIRRAVRNFRGKVGHMLGRSGSDDGSPGRRSDPPVVLHHFEPFSKLTSVHVNCEDERMLASGYERSVRLYDLETGKKVRDFENIHTNHINISRFAYHSPFIFATSSFDKTVKLWDTRQRTRTGPADQGEAPIYSVESSQGHVMVCFSNF